MVPKIKLLNSEKITICLSKRSEQIENKQYYHHDLMD